MSETPHNVHAHRRALATVDAALLPHLGWSVRDAWSSRDEPSASRNDPGTFAVTWALGRALLDVGVTPAWMVGQGAGAYAAAVLAGILDLEDACRLVATRSAAASLAGGSVETLAQVPIDPAQAQAQAQPKIPLYPTRAIALATEQAEVIELPAAGAPGGSGLFDVIARLYRAGLTPDWDALYEPGHRVRHRLTPYRFTATGRFWWNHPIGPTPGGSS